MGIRFGTSCDCSFGNLLYLNFQVPIFEFVWHVLKQRVGRSARKRFCKIIPSRGTFHLRQWDTCKLIHKEVRTIIISGVNRISTVSNFGSVLLCICIPKYNRIAILQNTSVMLQVSHNITHHPLKTLQSFEIPAGRGKSKGCWEVAGNEEKPKGYLGEAVGTSPLPWEIVDTVDGRNPAPPGMVKTL